MLFLLFLFLLSYGFYADAVSFPIPTLVELSATHPIIAEIAEDSLQRAQNEGLNQQEWEELFLRMLWRRGYSLKGMPFWREENLPTNIMAEIGENLNRYAAIQEEAARTGRARSIQAPIFVGAQELFNQMQARRMRQLQERMKAAGIQIQPQPVASEEETPTTPSAASTSTPTNAGLKRPHQDDEDGGAGGGTRGEPARSRRKLQF